MKINFLRFTFYIMVFLSGSFLSSCSKDEPTKILTPKEQNIEKLTANTWVLEGIMNSGNDVTDFQNQLGLRNSVLKFNKNYEYTSEPSSIIFKNRGSWLLLDDRNLKLDIATKNDQTIFINTLTDTKLVFEIYVDDPSQPLGEEYWIQYKKK